MMPLNLRGLGLASLALRLRDPDTALHLPGPDLAHDQDLQEAP